MTLYRVKALRRIVLPLLKRFSFDFWARHPWVQGQKTLLNSFSHKGYWYHGRNRERRTMELFSIMILPGATVVEVGGHIGFISQYFRSLVGGGGSVYVFEPGSNNLPYIKRNFASGSENYTDRKVVLIEAAVGKRSGTVDFYEENLTGQNNSVIKDFAGLTANQAVAYVKTATNRRSVNLVSLDEYFLHTTVDFIKIDIEGYEWSALQGASRLIARDRPALMVEIQADHERIFEFFRANGYALFNDKIEVREQPSDLRGNTFCLHGEKHRQLISDL